MRGHRRQASTTTAAARSMPLRYTRREMITTVTRPRQERSTSNWFGLGTGFVWGHAHEPPPPRPPSAPPPHRSPTRAATWPRILGRKWREHRRVHGVRYDADVEVVGASAGHQVVPAAQINTHTCTCTHESQAVFRPTPTPIHTPLTVLHLHHTAHLHRAANCSLIRTQTVLRNEGTRMHGR
jgi:hypothetical protein